MVRFDICSAHLLTHTMRRMPQQVDSSHTHGLIRRHDDPEPSHGMPFRIIDRGSHAPGIQMHEPVGHCITVLSRCINHR